MLTYTINYYNNLVVVSFIEYIFLIKRRIVKQLIFLFVIQLASISLMSQEDVGVKIYKDYESLSKDYFDIKDGKVHVINFWATWCKPCIKELPYIDALTSIYGDQVKVTLVSLDFPRKIKTKLIPYLEKNKLLSEVVMLDDNKVNEWIDKVDPSWSGAIPATIVFKNGVKMFYEKEFHSQEEVNEIITIINN